MHWITSLHHTFVWLQLRNRKPTRNLQGPYFGSLCICRSRERSRTTFRDIKDLWQVLWDQQ